MNSTRRFAARGWGGGTRIGLILWLGGMAGAGWAQENTNASMQASTNVPVQQAATASAQTPPSDPAVAQLCNEGFREMAAENSLEALQIFKEAAARDPKHPTVRFGLATALIAVKQNREALELLLGLSRDTPNDYYVLNNLAWLYATAAEIDIRDGDAAVRYARAALVLAPMDHFVWNTMSEAYFVAGQYERALRAAQEALRLGEMRGVPEAKLTDYRKRVEKCRVVLKATSILDE